MRIDPVETRPGDVMTYVHPVDRQVRHHRVLRRDEQKLGRLVVRYRGGKPVVEQEAPALRVVLLPELHSHELAVVRQEWVPLEDVIHVRRLP